MPKRIAVTNLNASTVDILNTIRQNANYEYQTLVPEIEKATDIPKVGEVIFGYPALANQFCNQLINRIALVVAKSATFNNAYAEYKKGYLEYGEVMEEVFVEICKAREFSAEKAEKRELKRTLPDVRTALHAINWNVQYPVTIQDIDLRTAFLSENGVQDLIARIVDAVYTANEYDEYLLFKYLLVKAISSGKMYPVSFDASEITDSAVKFRAMSNNLIFMKTQYNQAGVHTTTPRRDQLIIMDAEFNAKFDVEVLAGAFNMDKADFIGRLMLIDDWVSFDNDRFSTIRAESDMIEEVTSEELALLQNVKACIVDKEWFQVYDNLFMFTETYVSSGLYWNYFLNIRKTISSSPFSNAIVFVEGNEPVLPASITFNVTDKMETENSYIIALNTNETAPALTGGNILHQQTEAATTAGVAVQKYGTYIFSKDANAITPEITVNGTVYNGTSLNPATVKVGDTLNFTKSATTATVNAKVNKN